MSVFRRFNSMPSLSEIEAIEGIVLVDMPAPTDPSGLNSGCVGLVGEFPDQTFACAVSAAGVVTASIRPQEVTSGQDFFEKFGGFDPTIGAFGGQGGNGFHACANKKFSKLIVAPVFVASSLGSRLWRDLPTNVSVTNPTPVVPQLGAEVPAGTLFVTGANSLRVAKRAMFTGTSALATGVDGVAVSIGAPAATAAAVVFTSATGDFVNKGVAEGDVIVVGVISGASVNGVVADTLRVVSVDSATQLTLQKLDGTNFVEDTDWDGGASIVYRIHEASDADTGADHQLSEPQGFLIPVRNMKGSTIPLSTKLDPSVAADPGAATSWSPLSGLALLTHPSGVTSSDVWMAANSTSAQFTVLYASALQAFLRDESPINQATIIASARNTDDINTALLNFAVNASSSGRGRVAVLSPPLSDITVASATFGTGSSVSFDNKRAIYCWPGVRAFVPQALNQSVVIGDTTVAVDGVLDECSNMWMASLLSNLPPEHNPGQLAEPVPTLTQSILGFQRATSAISLTVNDYMTLKASGVATPSFDTEFGMAFQSGVTTSLIKGEKTILGVRMRDYINDTVAQQLKGYQKMPLTERAKNAMLTLVRAYLKSLLDAERITAFNVDGKSGNTAANLAKGIFTIIIKVQLTPSGDYIVIQSEVSEFTTV